MSSREDARAELARAREKIAQACALKPKRCVDVVDALERWRVASERAGERARESEPNARDLGSSASRFASSGESERAASARAFGLACRSSSSSVIASALGAFQHLIARGVIAGRAWDEGDEKGSERAGANAANATGEDDVDGSPSSPSSSAIASNVDAIAGNAEEEVNVTREIIDAICAAAETRDETVELQVLQTLLTAVSSRTFEVHGRVLLRVVRTCYNVYLSSKSEVNQNTAKATLTQMLTTVFHRLEADDPHALAPTIVVADLLRPIGADDDLEYASSMLNFVQSFVNKVSADINSVGSYSYFTDPDAVFKSDAVEHEITRSEFDNDTAPMSSSHESADALEAPSQDEGKNASDAASNQLETDAYLVFRSLCKLAKKPSSDVNGIALVRSKIISLQLLKIIIENAGDTFSTSARFPNAVREYLCDAIVTNATPNVAEAYQLACSIFLTLLTRYRAYLKAEIGFFFPLLLLKPLEVQEGEPLISYNQRATLVKGFQVLCTDAQLLVDLFVNFDCDLDGQNIFERYVSSLVRIAQGVENAQASAPEMARESSLKIEALECLTAMLASLNAWVETNLDHEPSTSGAIDNVEEESETGSTAAPLKTSASSEWKIGDSIAKLKADKQEFQEGISLFNKKAKKGLEFLQSIGRLGKSHEEIAEFLRTTPGLDKTVVGDYLGERDEPMLAVMHAYVDALDFTSLTLDDAIRKFLEGFRLPGESQKIDRLMEKFAERYHKLNPTVYKSADTAYVLAFSVIMLNTDAHNPQVKNKMTKEGFIRNNRGIDDGQDLPKEILDDLYERIVNNEIKMKAPADAALSTLEKKDKTNLSHRLGMDVLFALMSGKREEESLKIDTSELIDQVRARAATTKGFLVVHQAGCAKPMMEVIWSPILTVLTKAFEDSESVAVVTNCLEGLRRAINLTTLLGMRETRSAFIIPLSRLTFLHNPQMMRTKNVSAMKTLIRVSIDNGNDLGQMWTLILSCVSRYEQVYCLANGFDDSALFLDASYASAGEQTQSTRPRLFRRSLTPPGHSIKPVTRSDDASGVIESATELANSNADILEELIPPDRAVLEALSPDDLGHLFHSSKNLSGDAIVDFVSSLCELAIDETSSKCPRVYALGKIVEVASFNMDRIRFIWARVWQVLSEFFVTVGCSPNLQISMTVVDSLRQLAIKFLSRKELANYSFQNEFLRPFVVVMRQSPDVEIRELIIRCVSQMVQARVEHIKSGWKSMFMVFTTAAADERSQIVVLAFQTIERIIREHFHYIIETDTVAFTDCVNCLVAFTNSEAGSEVCLNALAFLRFCALKLAEGALGDLEETAATEKQLATDRPVDSALSKGNVATTCFTDADAHTYFWFPLLAGLSELTFDPRSEIRTSALEVLFDTLKFHGGSFASGFWARVYSRILFPIFDHVRADLAPQRRSGDLDDDTPALEDINDWLYGTCTRCLELVVDLAIQFHEPIVEAGVLPELLELLRGLTARSHEQLAACGVVAFKRLLVHGAAKIKAKEWSLCMNALKDTFEATKPDLNALDGDMSVENNLSSANTCLVRIKTQLLLVSAARDLATEYASARVDFNVDTLYILLDILESVHSNVSNAKVGLRGVDSTEVPSIVINTKPFYLALEVGAASIALRSLSRVQLKTGERTTQLVRLSRAALEKYLKLLDVRTGVDLREDTRVRAQICVDALDAVRALSLQDFKTHLPVLYPLFTRLIRCESSPCELSNSLCDLFTDRVGPLLVAM